MTATDRKEIRTKTMLLIILKVTLVLASTSVHEGTLAIATIITIPMGWAVMNV